MLCVVSLSLSLSIGTLQFGSYNTILVSMAYYDYSKNL